MPNLASGKATRTFRKRLNVLRDFFPVSLDPFHVTPRDCSGQFLLLLRKIIGVNRSVVLLPPTPRTVFGQSPPGQ
jgi:hypothetical protein